MCEPLVGAGSGAERDSEAFPRKRLPVEVTRKPFPSTRSVADADLRRSASDASEEVQGCLAPQDRLYKGDVVCWGRWVMHVDPYAVVDETRVHAPGPLHDHHGRVIPRRRAASRICMCCSAVGLFQTWSRVWPAARLSSASVAEPADAM